MTIKTNNPRVNLSIHVADAAYNMPPLMVHCTLQWPPVLGVREVRGNTQYVPVTVTRKARCDSPVKCFALSRLHYPSAPRDIKEGVTGACVPVVASKSPSMMVL